MFCFKAMALMVITCFSDANQTVGLFIHTTMSDKPDLPGS
jgi:hypothetical protein